MEPRSKSKRVRSMDDERSSLSELPEDIIIHILSVMDTREAVRTCVLSKQWRYYWTHVHSLNFRFPYLNWPYSFDFLTHVLHNRQQLKLSEIKIKFFGPRLAEDDEWKQKLILLALDYGTSHQIEELETDFRFRFFQSRNIETLAFGFGGCLKTLKLKGECYANIMIHDIISNCPNLENLVLISCSSHHRYSIYHPRLVSLHLTDYDMCRPDAVIEVKAPSLKFFDLHLASPVIVDLDDCPSIDKVNIYLSVRTTFAYNSAPELAWYQLVPELPRNVIVCVMRDGYPHFDVRSRYDYNSITYFLSRMTRMCKVLRDVGSGTVLLHVFGEEMILHCSKADDQSDSDAELDFWSDSWAETASAGDCENIKSVLLIKDVLRTIRSGVVLGFLDAVKVMKNYVSEPFQRISYPDFRSGRKKDDFIISSSLLEILWGDEWKKIALGR